MMIEPQVIELQPVCDDLFQINYLESPESVGTVHVSLAMGSNQNSLSSALDQFRNQTGLSEALRTHRRKPASTAPGE